MIIKLSEWLTHRDIPHKPSERLDQVKETVEKVQQEEKSFKPFQDYKIWRIK